MTAEKALSVKIVSYMMMLICTTDDALKRANEPKNYQTEQTKP